MAGFERTLDELFARAAPRVAAGRRLRRGRARAPLGAALPTGAHGRHRPRGGVDPGRLGAAPGAQPRVPRDAGARTCRSPTDEFELASAIEVLEHVPDPEHTLAEMARCAEPPPARVGAARAAVADAEHGPRRLLARARQHARATSTTGPSARSCELLSRPRRGRRGALAVPLDDVACPRSERRSPAKPATGAAAKTRSYGSGARILSIGIASTGLLTFAYFSIASHVLGEADGQARSTCCGRSCS